MNIIAIVTDTFRRDHVGCYGATWMHTPNIDRFAQTATRFNRFYPANFPTLPNRLDLFTGRFSYTYASWEPLPKDETTLAEMLTRAGYTTQLIADTPHPFRPHMGYHRGFQAWDVLRGQENDQQWTYDANSFEFPCDPAKLRNGFKVLAQQSANAMHWECEEDTFVAKTMRRASTWLEKHNRRNKFFLYIDTFDPHEPWLAPRAYVDLYDKGYKGNQVVYPRYAKADYLTAAEKRHMRAAYAAEATLTDRWIGHLLGKIESLNLMNDTAVLIFSDHGFLLGEHNLTGKLFIADDGKQTWMPMYEALIGVPLLIRAPGVKGARATGAVCSTPDVTATILDLAGVKPHPRVQGLSLKPALTGKSARHRDIAVTSVSFKYSDFSETMISPASINDGRYTYLYGGSDHPSGLYDLKTDPGQEKNLIRKEKDRALNLHKKFIRWIEKLEAKENYVDMRRKPRF